MVQEFLAWAEKEKWNIKMREEQFALPDEIQQRYRIPAEWLAFIEHFSLWADEDGTKWFSRFLCPWKESTSTVRLTRRPVK